jgi:hypothetical protein
MLALRNRYLRRLHLVCVVVTLSSHGTETEPRPCNIFCGSLVKIACRSSSSIPSAVLGIEEWKVWCFFCAGWLAQTSEVEGATRVNIPKHEAGRI